jgi:hypothetical protein
MDGGSLEALLAAYVPIARAARLTILGLPEQVIAHILLQASNALVFLLAHYFVDAITLFSAGQPGSLFWDCLNNHRTHPPAGEPVPSRCS